MASRWRWGRETNTMMTMGAASSTDVTALSVVVNADALRITEREECNVVENVERRDMSVPRMDDGRQLRGLRGVADPSMHL